MMLRHDEGMPDRGATPGKRVVVVVIIQGEGTRNVRVRA